MRQKERPIECLTDLLAEGSMGDAGFTVGLGYCPNASGDRWKDGGGCKKYPGVILKNNGDNGSGAGFLRCEQCIKDKFNILERGE